LLGLALKLYYAFANNLQSCVHRFLQQARCATTSEYLQKHGIATVAINPSRLQTTGSHQTTSNSRQRHVLSKNPKLNTHKRGDCCLRRCHLNLEHSATVRTFTDRQLNRFVIVEKNLFLVNRPLHLNDLVAQKLQKKHNICVNCRYSS
jgi:hypothetical protein